MTPKYRARAVVLRRMAADLIALADQLDGLTQTKPPEPMPWLEPAGEMWRAAVGEPVWARFVKALKPLVARLTWEVVEPALRSYLVSKPYQRRDGSIWGDAVSDGPHNAVQADTRWMTPEDFVRTFATWQHRAAL